MKKLFALFLMIPALVSCQKDQTDIDPGGDYFPLNIGNYWYYEPAGKYLVKDSQLSDGDEYFEVTDEYGISSFYVIRDNKIYVRGFSMNNKEEMIFDLTAQPDETWEYGPGSVTLSDRNATIEIGNVQVDSCLKFHFYNNNAMDYDHFIWLAPGIGIVQRTCQECFVSGPEIIKLNKVNINNKETEFK